MKYDNFLSIYYVIFFNYTGDLYFLENYNYFNCSFVFISFVKHKKRISKYFSSILKSVIN